MNFKSLMHYYDNPYYHIQARNRALQMKSKRLRKIRELMGYNYGIVLELGCGFGIYSNDFDWIGIDISRTVLAINRNRNVIQASALKLPFRKEVFSLVTMFDLIEHLNDQEVALLEVIRVLKYDGFLAIGSPPLVWEILLSSEYSNYKRKINKINHIFIDGLITKKLLLTLSKHIIPIIKEFTQRIRDEFLIIVAKKKVTLRPILIIPDYSKVGEDYDAIYAYNPNAVVNFLRSRNFRIVDLRPMPIRIFRLPTPDVGIILARKQRYNI